MLLAAYRSVLLGIAMLALGACSAISWPGTDSTSADQTVHRQVASIETGLADHRETGAHQRQGTVEGSTAERLPFAGDGTDSGSFQVASSDELDDLRGGFIDVNGLRIDFSVELRTVIDGVEQIRTVGTLTDFLSGLAAVTSTVEGVARTGGGNVVVRGQTGETTVVQQLTASEISSTVVNSQSGIDVRNQATVVVRVLDIGNPRVGRAFQARRGLDLETGRAFRGAIAR
jgi:hypothetical protein